MGGGRKGSLLKGKMKRKEREGRREEGKEGERKSYWKRERREN